MKTVKQELVRRLQWGCRRGMLELDLILEPFAAQLEKLSAAELTIAQELLELDDVELWDMIVTGKKSVPQKFLPLIANLNYSPISSA